MNILFLSNWSIHDGITQATIFPIIGELEKHPDVKKLVFCTIEIRHDNYVPYFNKTLHFPLKSKTSVGLGKLFSFLGHTLKIRTILKDHKIDFFWCRGATAGGLGALINLITGIPFVVDSFEPHSQYMVDSGTWKRESYKFRIQLFLEHLAKKKAKLLLPVSYKYHQHLLTNGLKASKLFTFPCVVDLKMFEFNTNDRNRLRSSLKISDETVVGIYTGKFGGLYHEEEAFQLYKHAFDFWKNNFFLIILTEMAPKFLLEKLKSKDISDDRIFINKIAHREVPQYLSAADFAFSSIKSVPAMRFCSPIKHGEYWAADLPILTTLAFGDDADIMMEEGGGIITKPDSDDNKLQFKALQSLINQGRIGLNTSLALKYRNPVIMKNAIQFVMENMVTKDQSRD